MAVIVNEAASICNIGCERIFCSRQSAATANLRSMSLTLRSYAIVLGVAGVYGVICRLLFASPQLSDWLQIVSIAFIYTMPLSLGALV